MPRHIEYVATMLIGLTKSPLRRIHGDEAVVLVSACCQLATCQGRFRMRALVRTGEPDAGLAGSSDDCTLQANAPGRLTTLGSLVRVRRVTSGEYQRWNKGEQLAARCS